MAAPKKMVTTQDTLPSRLRAAARDRLAPAGQAWLDGAAAEIARGVAAERFGALLSLASRHVPRRPLSPTAEERREAAARLPGLEVERWTLLETARVGLILARPDLANAEAVAATESAFRFADEGELCALYRSLALWPDAGRFRWRAGEGCRTNMRSVFEAVACDTPYPAAWFDDVAFQQCVVKAVFVGAPVWRIVALDRRLTPELARIALDLADERRSAGRPVPPELWLAVGRHGGERGVASLLKELDPANPERLGRRAAALGLARAGEAARLAELRAKERDAEVKATLEAAERLARVGAGAPDAAAFHTALVSAHSGA